MNNRLIERRSLASQSYEILKRRILVREFQPNEKLSVERMAKLLGVSRTPVKDALNRLEADGLITIKPRVGSYVTPLTRKDVEEIFDTRYLIELYAAERGITQVAPQQLMQMESLLAQMDEQILIRETELEKVEQLLQLDFSFHQLLVEIADNGRLIKFYEGLEIYMYITHFYHIQNLEIAQLSQTHHKRIVEAYHDQDLDKLKDVLGGHILRAKEFLLNRLSGVEEVL